MLPPHELKKKEFTRVIRGYNAAEVDEHFDFMIAQYTELYRAYDALEKQLRTVTAQYDSIRKDEEAIRGALVNAQRAGAGIIRDANERADIVMQASKTNCDKIIADFREEIRRETKQLETLRNTVAEFKKQLFGLYQKHIGLIESIPLECEAYPEELPEEDDLVQMAVAGMKSDISEILMHRASAPVKAESPKVLPTEETQDVADEPQPSGQAETEEISEQSELSETPAREEVHEIETEEEQEDIASVSCPVNESAEQDSIPATEIIDDTFVVPPLTEEIEASDEADSLDSFSSEEDAEAEIPNLNRETEIETESQDDEDVALKEALKVFAQMDDEIPETAIRAVAEACGDIEADEIYTDGDSISPVSNQDGSPDIDEKTPMTSKTEKPSEPLPRQPITPKPAEKKSESVQDIPVQKSENGRGQSSILGSLRQVQQQIGQNKATPKATSVKSAENDADFSEWDDILDGLHPEDTKKH